MIYKAHRNYLLFFSLLLLNGCGVHKIVGSAEMKMLESPALGYGTNSTASALVYKTQADYFNRVPVGMNAEKDRIISYPDPSDLFYGDIPALPTRLKDGYLLDNRGIGTNVAFLTYTYETYHALSKVPPLNQLMDSLLERNPLTELWDCGARSLYKNEVEELNALIDRGFPNSKALIEVLSITTKITQP